VPAITKINGTAIVIVAWYIIYAERLALTPTINVIPKLTKNLERSEAYTLKSSKSETFHKYTLNPSF
jgi:hypothetical protein